MTLHLVRNFLWNNRCLNYPLLSAEEGSRRNNRFQGCAHFPAKSTEFRSYRCFCKIDSWFASTGAPSFSPAGSIENIYLFHHGPAAQ